MRDEIKDICDRIIEENKKFEYSDALFFCIEDVRSLKLEGSEHVDAMVHVLVGLDNAQEDPC